MDSGDAGLGNQDSNVVMEDLVTVPDGTVTLSAGKVSTMTPIVILPIMSGALAEENASLISRGESETGLVGTFHLVSNPDAAPASSNGQVAWVRPASINVFDRYLKEPLEELLITQFGSPNGALCFTE